MDEVDSVVNHESAEFNILLEACRRRSFNEASVDTESVRYCEDCGIEIPKARIKAVPMCTRCVSCQNQIEGN